MDADQFDHIAKRLTSGTNRRRLVTGLGANLLAALVAVPDAEARRQRRRTRRRWWERFGPGQLPAL